MGSGVLLAIVVVLWFVVLVPMVLTHRDLTRDAQASDRVSPRARVLARRGSGPVTSEPETAPTDTEPTEDDVRDVDANREADRPDRPDRIDRLEEEPVRRPRLPALSRAAVLRRRRRILVGLAVTAMLFAFLAIVATSRFWMGHVLLDLLLVGYVVQLRRNAQRDRRTSINAAYVREVARQLRYPDYVEQHEASRREADRELRAEAERRAEAEHRAEAERLAEADSRAAEAERRAAAARQAAARPADVAEAPSPPAFRAPRSEHVARRRTYAANYDPTQVIGIDDDDLSFSHIDDYQPPRAVNG